MEKQNCDTCTKHKSSIEGQTIEGLAIKIGDLRYDVLMEFFDHLQKKIKMDYEKDQKSGRKKLANELNMISYRLNQAKIHSNKAWNICKKYMIIKD